MITSVTSRRCSEALQSWAQHLQIPKSMATEPQVCKNYTHISEWSRFVSRLINIQSFERSFSLSVSVCVHNIYNPIPIVTNGFSISFAENPSALVDKASLCTTGCLCVLPSEVVFLQFPKIRCLCFHICTLLQGTGNILSNNDEEKYHYCCHLQTS